MEDEQKRKIRSIQMQLWKEINEAILKAEKKLWECTSCQEITFGK